MIIGTFLWESAQQPLIVHNIFPITLKNKIEENIEMLHIRVKPYRKLLWVVYYGRVIFPSISDISAEYEYVSVFYVPKENAYLSALSLGYCSHIVLGSDARFVVGYISGGTESRWGNGGRCGLRWEIRAMLGENWLYYS